MSSLLHRRRMALALSASFLTLPVAIATASAQTATPPTDCPVGTTLAQDGTCKPSATIPTDQGAAAPEDEAIVVAGSILGTYIRIGAAVHF